jgi:hypothetical protein
MTEKERYLFDLQGFLVVPDALTAAELSDLNAEYDKQVAAHVKPDAAHHRFTHLLPWSKAYRNLIDNPRILPYLTELMGEDFRLDHDYSDVIRRHDGPNGTRLHGGGSPFDPCCFFRHQNGRTYSGLTVVAYNIKDVNPGDGGFGCVPGSHKANYPFPGEWLDLHEMQLSFMKAVTGPAGTAIIFTEALTHGTLPWTGKQERRTLFYKYSPGAISWHAQYYDAGNYDGLTDRQRAILEAPNARYQYRKPGIFSGTDHD